MAHFSGEPQGLASQDGPSVFIKVIGREQFQRRCRVVDQLLYPEPFRLCGEHHRCGPGGVRVPAEPSGVPGDEPDENSEADIGHRVRECGEAHIVVACRREAGHQENRAQQAGGGECLPPAAEDDGRARGHRDGCGEARVPPAGRGGSGSDENHDADEKEHAERKVDNAEPRLVESSASPDAPADHGRLRYEQAERCDREHLMVGPLDDQLQTHCDLDDIEAAQADVGDD